MEHACHAYVSVDKRGFVVPKVVTEIHIFIAVAPRNKKDLQSRLQSPSIHFLLTATYSNSTVDVRP